MNRTPIRRRAKTPKKLADEPGRRKYVQNQIGCEYSWINGCTNFQTDAEHAFGRGWNGADDPRCLLARCRKCHGEVGRGAEARVNMLWIKLQGMAEAWDWNGMGDYDPETYRRKFRRLVTWLEPRARWERTELLVWRDGGKLSPGALERCNELCEVLGIE